MRATNPAKTHELKCWPQFFQPMIDGKKTFDMRIDDRGYHVGDILVQSEYDPLLAQYTGRWFVGEVTSILHPIDFDAVPAGWCIMSVHVFMVGGSRS